MCNEIAEKWERIIDAPRYEVSNTGNIRDLDRGILVQPSVSYPVKHRNYPLEYVELKTPDGFSKTCHVHILVAKYFLPNPMFYRFVDHKDGNFENNNVSNLEWVESREVCEDRYQKYLKEKNRGEEVKEGDKLSYAEPYMEGDKYILSKEFIVANSLEGEHWYMPLNFSTYIISDKGRCRRYKSPQIDKVKDRYIQPIKRSPNRLKFKMQRDDGKKLEQFYDELMSGSKTLIV